MFYYLRYSLLLAVLISLPLVGCGKQLQSSSPSQETVEQPKPELSPEAKEQAEAFVSEGNQKLADGDYEGAIAAFDEALAIDGSNAKAFGDRGVARSRLKNYQGALADYNQALTLNAQAYEVYYNRGIVQTNLDDYESAIEDFTQAIKYKPNFARAFGNRGFAYAELEDYTAAIKDLEKAAAIFEERGNKQTSYRLQRAARYIQP